MQKGNPDSHNGPVSWECGICSYFWLADQVNIYIEGVHIVIHEYLHKSNLNVSSPINVLQPIVFVYLWKSVACYLGLITRRPLYAMAWKYR